MARTVIATLVYLFATSVHAGLVSYAYGGLATGGGGIYGNQRGDEVSGTVSFDTDKAFISFDDTDYSWSFPDGVLNLTVGSDSYQYRGVVSFFLSGWSFRTFFNTFGDYPTYGFVLSGDQSLDSDPAFSGPYTEAIGSLLSILDNLDLSVFDSKLTSTQGILEGYDEAFIDPDFDRVIGSVFFEWNSFSRVSVPEPATLGLLGAGLIGLGVMRRKRAA